MTSLEDQLKSCRVELRKIEMDLMMTRSRKHVKKLTSKRKQLVNLIDFGNSQIFQRHLAAHPVSLSKHTPEQKRSLSEPAKDSRHNSFRVLTQEIFESREYPHAGVGFDLRKHLNSA